MTESYLALTEKEKATLRLLLVGYDAKTMARHLGLSVHTVNERLRDSRRKLSVSSSREAARLLRDAEGDPPYSLADKPLGDADVAIGAAQGGPPRDGSWTGRPAVWIIGGLTMSLVIALLALSATSQVAEHSADAPATAASSPAPAEAAVAQSAREWLALGDAGKWREGFLATTRSFQAVNTLAMWEAASKSARVPLGAMLSRTLIGVQSVPAPPHGYEMVRFRTRFANRAEAIETVSLVREGDSWKVAGIYID